MIIPIYVEQDPEQDQPTVRAVDFPSQYKLHVNHHYY